MDEAWVEGNSIAIANSWHCQGFIKAKEVKPLLELATEALFYKKAVTP